jgi:hypothetical protein
MTQPLADDLAYWILEREAMRKRKEAGGKFPFSQDKVMATTRFTNVRREDDKVTKWLKNHWRDPYASHPNLPVAMVLARMLNYIPTLELVGFPEVWQPEITITKLKKRAEHYKVWSSAYLITTCGKPMGKEEYVVNHVCSAVHRRIQPAILNSTKLADCYQILRSIDGLGSFLAAQVVADLKNIKSLPLASAPDWHTWSAPGPGSLAGLSYFWDADITPRIYEASLSKAWDLVKPKLTPDLQDLSMQDFQNCMCEFSKFMRIKSGGQARNRYGV